jgi:hypothetical protein
MTADPERSARIIENFVVGDGGSRDTALCGLAVQVRAMGANSSEIAAWVSSHGHHRGLDADTLQAILEAIASGAEAK